MHQCLMLKESYKNHVTDWPALLQSDLGITDLTTQSLLLHRHEFQEGACLEPQEKKQVDQLKLKLGITSAQ